MRKLLGLWAILSLLTSTTGCITGRVAEAAGRWRRAHGERLTAVSVTNDERGSPYGVVALEAECRVAPGDPEGGPGALAYTLPRSPLRGDEGRFLASKRVEPVAAYRSRAGFERGFPSRVLLAEERDGEAVIFLGTPSGWAEVPVARYLHEGASPGHPVAATLTNIVVVPFALVADLVTWPIQWLLAPWFDVTPP